MLAIQQVVPVLAEIGAAKLRQCFCYLYLFHRRQTPIEPPLAFPDLVLGHGEHEIRLSRRERELFPLAPTPGQPLQRIREPASSILGETYG